MRLSGTKPIAFGPSLCISMLGNAAKSACSTAAGEKASQLCRCNKLPLMHRKTAFCFYEGETNWCSSERRWNDSSELFFFLPVTYRQISVAHRCAHDRQQKGESPEPHPRWAMRGWAMRCQEQEHSPGWARLQIVFRLCLGGRCQSQSQSALPVQCPGHGECCWV